MKPCSCNAHSSVRLRLQDDSVAHPGITDSVMSYDRLTGVSEPDCAPYPLDILAIRALYQALNP